MAVSIVVLVLSILATDMNIACRLQVSPDYDFLYSREASSDEGAMVPFGDTTDSMSGTDRNGTCRPGKDARHILNDTNADAVVERLKAENNALVLRIDSLEKEISVFKRQRARPLAQRSNLNRSTNRSENCSITQTHSTTDAKDLFEWLLICCLLMMTIIPLIILFTVGDIHKKPNQNY